MTLMIILECKSTDNYHMSQKTAPYYVCNNFIKPGSI